MKFKSQSLALSVLCTVQCFLLISARDGKVDSYLAAYMESKYQDKNTQVVYSTPMEESNSPNSEYGAPDNTQNEVDNGGDYNTSGEKTENKIPPSTSYGVPDLNQTYRIPTQPREPVTQKPLTQYGPPKYYYGPPKPVYGPPQAQYGPPMMEMSRMPMMLSHFQGLANQFLESPESIKLILGTALKLFLKIMVFKFIVKFFVMIALLLVIPKFDMGSMMMSDDKNKSRTISDETLDSLSKFVEDSLEAFRTGGSIFPTCTEETEQRDSNVKLFCELKRSAKSLNETFSFSKLFPTFLTEYLEKQLHQQETT